MARPKQPEVEPPAPSAAEIARWRALSDAQTKHEADGGLSRTGPLFREAARLELEDYEQRFADGDEWALVQALQTCAVHELVLPDWAARQWLRRTRAAAHYEVGSWDEVMPAIKPKGSKLPALRMARRWRLVVRRAVLTEKQKRKETAISDELFATLAERERWPFSGSSAKKLYYSLNLSGKPRAKRGRVLRSSKIRSNT